MWYTNPNARTNFSSTTRQIKRKKEKIAVPGLWPFKEQELQFLKERQERREAEREKHKELNQQKRKVKLLVDVRGVDNIQRLRVRVAFILESGGAAPFSHEQARMEDSCSNLLIVIEFEI